MARAIRACAVPVVTGIGHEVDYTIADFVADVRAPTPSGAAELVVPDRAEWLRAFQGLEQRLVNGFARARAERVTRLAWAVRQLDQLHPGRRLAERAQRVDELEARLARALRQAAAQAGARLHWTATALRRVSPAGRLSALESRRAALGARLESLLRTRVATARGRMAVAARALDAVSPLATLVRGYSIVERDGRVVTSAGAVEPGDAIRVRTAQGAILGVVTGREE